MLDTRLVTFLTLCQTKSFTKTAEKLHITQPAVSHHIKYLEGYYHTKLYTYTNRRFVLTPTGRMLYQYVNSVHSDSERIREHLSLISSSTKELRLGAEQSAGESFLPYLIIAFMEKYPDYKIRIVTDNYDALSRMLNEGELDFFLMDGIVSKSEHDYYELCSSSTICACSPEHPLSEKSVSIQELYNSTLILGVDKTPSRNRLEQIFRDNNISSMRFAHRIEISNSLTTVKQLLIQNTGISFLYKSAVARELKEGSIRQIYIRDYYEYHSYKLISIHNSYFYPEQTDFIKFCQDFLKQWDSDI